MYEVWSTANGLTVKAIQLLCEELWKVHVEWFVIALPSVGIYNCLAWVSKAGPTTTEQDVDRLTQYHIQWISGFIKIQGMESEPSTSFKLCANATSKVPSHTDL